MAQGPLVSVVIPTYGRPEALEDCLAALAGQDFPREEFEVIVVDDGSSHPTAVKRGDIEGLNLKEARQRHQGPAVARNLGAENARGRFLAFTDDDCVPDRAWLKRLVARLGAEADCLFGGRVINGVPDSLCATASQVILDQAYAYHNQNPEDACFFASSNIAVSKEAFRSLGGFDASFSRIAGEDREFCDRWRHSGRRMVYASDCTVRHNRILDMASLCRQHFQYGRGACHFYRVHRGRAGGRPRPDPDFYLRLLKYPWTSRLPRAISLTALVMLAELANAAGYAWQALRPEVAGVHVRQPESRLSA